LIHFLLFRQQLRIVGSFLGSKLRVIGGLLFPGRALREESISIDFILLSIVCRSDRSRHDIFGGFPRAFLSLLCY
jgi:hypothetical protein